MKKVTAIFLIASVATLRVGSTDEPQQPQAVVTQEEKAPEPAPAQQTPIVSTEVPESSEQQPISTEPQSDEKPAYTHVSKASHDSAAAEKSKRWRNIFIAVGAVAIAITALILVHNNAGH